MATDDPIRKLEFGKRADITADYRTMAIGLLFSSAIGLLDFRNIEYRIGEFKKLSDYQLSDQGLNLSDSE
jgi:hypothetical protein